MGKFLLVVVAFVGCSSSSGTDAEPEHCEAATQYLGPDVPCDDGAGVCIQVRDTIECRHRCATTSPICGDGEQYAGTQTADHFVCYCEPAGLILYPPYPQ